uniref:NADH-ubiquinone oxidoreductase chain 4L n=1 Tax=Solenocera crassicornis TaxID=228863 RepID=A0A172W6K5_9EUCA|nr:NADH dehydrogenase subunit 4L [Solenocera crassicornis]YP_010580176.1 NADH dehydrogenase subunit 4L [Solenocera melantho]ANF05080.1 NADH dehydrogenase subunit 4L [Solenocera crassicornis]AXJ93131.1 NADH dehydrogenase subunit 4L [Solenocera crassicornis]UZS90560.1 NADH dehydrogenase subunit 4l [Solenocera melantho]
MLILSVYYFVPLISVSCGLWVFVSKRKHLLNTLLSLEFIMLSVFWFMSIHLSNLGHEGYFVLFFLTLAACEGALGLALLVSVVRTHGNDCFSSFGVLQC